jgi:hypothetical protein
VSLDAMDWVWEHSQAGGLARFVLIAIADKARGPECKAYASLSFLEKRLGVTRPTVISALRSAHDLGELETVEGEKGPYGASVYRLPKAQGHLRSAPESVNDFYRSVESGGDQAGKAPSPIEPEATEPGKNALPIEPDGLPESGKAALPIQAGSDEAIGQGALPPEGQIGKAPTPLHQKTHQVEIDIPLPPVVAPPSKRGRRAPDPKITAGLARFDEFYAIYPVDAKRDRAKTEWDKAIKAGADADAVIKAAQRYAEERAGQDEQYTAFAANWLKDKRWNDKPRKRPQSGPGAGPYRNDPDKDRSAGFPGAIIYEGA